MMVGRRKPKIPLRTKGKGKARDQLAARQNTAVTALGTVLPAALSPRAYRRSKKVWP
jgi:hypothetical protein